MIRFLNLFLQRQHPPDDSPWPILLVAAPASSRLRIYVQATNALQTGWVGCDAHLVACCLNLHRDAHVRLCNPLKLRQKSLLHVEQRCISRSEGISVLLLSPHQRPCAS